VTNPRDVVLWDKAGERIMARAAELAAKVPGTGSISLYKNNTDNKGASYGTHENYLMRRETPFAEIVARDAVLRQPPGRHRLGRVGIGQDGRATASRSASAPTSSRSRSASRRRSSARSSTRGTSRTPTRRSTAGCT
jgi:hypothetical protein